jgi:hypothetical protein
VKVEQPDNVIRTTFVKVHLDLLRKVVEIIAHAMKLDGNDPDFALRRQLRVEPFVEEYGQGLSPCLTAFSVTFDK